MRLVETLLTIANLLTFACLIVPRLRAISWASYSPAVALVIAIAQIVIEGPRWQMLPAYVLAIAFFLIWLLRISFPGRFHAKRFKRLIAIIGTGLGIFCLMTATALPILLPVFQFLKPAGPYQIGTLTYHWTENQPEIFSTDPNAHRQLMAQVWYPVLGDKSSIRAPYVQDADALSATIGRSTNLPEFLLDHLEYVATNGIPSAPIAPMKSRYPVLVFLTGVDGYRQSNTFQVENLVSNGYIVVGIDQPYVAAAVTFPNGQIISGWTRDQIQPLINQSLSPSGQSPTVNGHTLPNGIIPYLTGDVSFTLDQLAKLDAKDPDNILTGHLDLTHLGAFGVSLGAMVTGQACHVDPRIKACLMADAAMPADVVSAGLRQSAMWLTRPAGDMRLEKWQESDIALTLDSMRAVYNTESRGEAYYVQIPGMFHVNFTDAPYFSPIANLLGFSGPINPQRGFSVVNAYTLAFFNQSLAGGPSALLTGQSAQYPEVSFTKR